MAEIAPGIEVDVNICHGKPVISGSRVPVRTVLGAIAAGDPIEQVAEDYGVTVEAIRRAIAFANEVVGESSFVPTAGAC
jgi:uncharacterized protein (DUF433 family)